MNRTVAVILIFIFVLTSCSSQKKTVKKLPNELSIKETVVDSSDKIKNLLFAKEVTKIKISGISPDKKGVNLSYELDEDDTSKIIDMLQSEGVLGEHTTKSSYTAVTKRDNYGIIIEFVDGLDRFYEGVVRITCFTVAGENFLSLINDDGKTELYKIALPKEVISFINEKSIANYNDSGDGKNTGWFNKAFKNNK